MAEQGVLLENNKDKAQVILEPSFGAYGTDMRDTNVGLPGMSLDAVAHHRCDGRQLREFEFAQLLADQPRRRGGQGDPVCLRRKTGRLVWESGWLLNAQGVRDHFFMGAGPYRMSSRGEVEHYPDESQVQTRKHFFQRLIGAFHGSDSSAQ